MNAQPLPQFGTFMAGVQYVGRVSVYGIAINEAGLVLVCKRTMDRIVLPGGGVDEGEQLVDALHREVAEETGHKVIRSRLLFEAHQYHAQRRRKPPANKHCHFFSVDVRFDPAIEKEDDHDPVWLPPHRLIHSMTFESHSWALEKAIQLQQQNG